MARNKYPEETRKLILDTAARLFTEKGYDHTSVQDIIDHLGGLSKGAIYHHFKSKEEIMTAVAEEMYSDVGPRMQQIMASKDMNGLEKLRQMFVTTASNPVQKDMFTAAPDMLKNPKLFMMYFHDSVQVEATELVRQILEEGIQDGSIQTDYPKQVAETVMLLGNIWMNPMVYHCSPEEMGKKLKFFQLILRMLGLDVMPDDMIETMQEYAEIYEKSTE